MFSAGVKVYTVVWVLFKAGDQVPVILPEVVGNAFNVVEKQILVSKFATPTAPRVDVHGTAVMRREARSGDCCPF